MSVPVQSKKADSAVPPAKLESRHVTSSMDEELQRCATGAPSCWIQSFKGGVYLIFDDEFTLLSCHATPFCSCYAGRRKSPTVCSSLRSSVALCQ